MGSLREPELSTRAMATPKRDPIRARLRHGGRANALVSRLGATPSVRRVRGGLMNRAVDSLPYDSVIVNGEVPSGQARSFRAKPCISLASRRAARDGATFHPDPRKRRQSGAPATVAPGAAVILAAKCDPVLLHAVSLHCPRRPTQWRQSTSFRTVAVLEVCIDA